MSAVRPRPRRLAWACWSPRIAAPLCAAPAFALGAATASPQDHAGVIGLREDYLSAAHWIAQMSDPDRVILDRAGKEHLQRVAEKRERVLVMAEPGILLEQ